MFRQKQRVPNQDHPRICGEKTNLSSENMNEEGSPPRMRGKGPRLREACPAVGITPAMRGKDGFVILLYRDGGITPAYAGKRSGSTHPRRTPGDHPRACGEKVAPSRFFGMRRGSSPRMRGKVVVLIAIRTAQRITPAYAGKSSFSWHPLSPPWDHPRVCGEKGEQTARPHYHMGSPPRMRGKAKKIP